MATKDAGQAAQEALRRMLGERIVEETPFNAGTPRDTATVDAVVASTDLGGKSHQAYTKRLADEAAARQALAAQQEAARQAALAAGQAAPAATGASAPASVVAQTQLSQGYFMPRKSYQTYYAGNQAALSKAGYSGSGTSLGANQQWGSSGNPYAFRNQYNKYLGDTLQQERSQLTAANKALAYNQYYAGNQAAMDSVYRSSDINAGANQNWGSGGNPYQYSNEYNKYLDSRGYKMGQSEPIYTKLGAVTPFKAMSYI